ncbi:MAG: hypothetical protein HGA47_01370 [Zoogloea sp.]|nr:hypothetical protein [Zoogloea sp.]
MEDESPGLGRLLFRYWWPFWLFRDASRGDLFARAAAYRYNREQRIYLPGYLLRWTLMNSLMLALVHSCQQAASEAGGMQTLFTWLAAGSGLLFAFGCAVVMNMGYVYLYLSRHAP